MALRTNTIRQRDFSGGEIDPTALRRDDTKIFKTALRRARNVRALPSGALSRRPGRSILYFDGGRHDTVRPFSDATFDVTFAANRFTARLPGGAIVSNLVAPWTADNLPDIVWTVAQAYIFVACRGMIPQVITYDRDAGTWSIANFAFRTGIGGTVKAPFYRFKNDGSTIQPSALSGSITLTASVAIFKPGHVGCVFRYAVVQGLVSGSQVQITAVATDGKSATATVLEKLPATYRVTLNSTEGYQVGEIVTGDVSNTAAQVVAINSSTGMDVLLLKGYSAFYIDATTPADSDTLVGEKGNGVISAQTTTGPGFAATNLWDEQFISPVRGYPGSVSFDLDRVIFCDFPQLENAILWTAIGTYDDLEITGDAAAAIFELAPDAGRIYFVAAGADEFVLTDTRVYYIPISGATPLAPGSVEFRRIGTAGAARVKPIALADGLVFVGESTKRIYAVIATGTLTQPYRIVPINPFHEHLFASPSALAASDGDQDTNPGQALYVVNGDGSVVVGIGTPNDATVGWFPWTGAGNVTDVTSRYGEVTFAVSYPLNSGTVETVETIDNSAMFDGSVPLTDFVGTDPLRDSTGAAIEDSKGAAITAVSGALLPFANETLQGWADGFFLGDLSVDLTGRVAIDEQDLSNVVIGWNFLPEVQPLIEDAEGGSGASDVKPRLRRRKIARVALAVQNTQTFDADGHTFGSYRVGADMGQVPARDAVYRYRQHARSDDPQVQISQPTPGSFTLLEFSAEVTI